MKVFEEAALRDFEDRLVRHVRDNFPLSFSMLGEDGARAIGRSAIERASAHGLNSERSVFMYLSLMLMLGSEFDTDPQLPWAAEILGDMEPGEVGRIDALYDKALDYLAQVAGPDAKYMLAALERLQREPLEGVPAPSGPEFYAHVLARLSIIYPEKCRYVGELSLRRMVGRAIERAASHGITDGRGVAIYVGLMFMLGGGFDSDPQLPWVADVLNSKEVEGGEGKAERLRAASLERLALLMS